jgi:hypothetical protein
MAVELLFVTSGTKNNIGFNIKNKSIQIKALSAAIYFQ